MKKILIALVFTFVFGSILVAQEVPLGMKYQAVARDLKGEVLTNEQVSLRISLFSFKNAIVNTYYSEIHDIATNEIGLFSLVVGEGRGEKIKFKNIPWGNEEIWMEVAIAEKGKSGYTPISSSKLMSVPYAFHAGTASKIAGNPNPVKEANEPASNSGNSWSLPGNLKTNPTIDYLGTADNQDLVLRTNAFERMRVTKDGDLNLLNNVNLNSAPGFLGNTINNGNFTVANAKAANLSGILDVTGATHLKSTLIADGATNLNGNLNVNGLKPTFLSGTLTVDKLVVFNDPLNSVTKDDGALVVEGGVGIEKTLNVGGDLNVTGTATLGKIVTEGSTSKSLLIEDDNIKHVATFKNTNEGVGDGIKIQLGRTHPTWDGSSYKNFTNPVPETFDPAITQINKYIDGTDTWSLDDLTQLVPNTILVGSVIKLTNFLIPKINKGLELPLRMDLPALLGFPSGLKIDVLKEIGIPNGLSFDLNSILAAKTIGPYGTPTQHIDIVIAEFDVPGVTVVPTITIIPDVPSFTLIPDIGPATLIPDIPEFTLIPEIPLIPETVPFPSFSLPNLSFLNVTNSLTKENEFISFTDKEDRTLGRIRAQSLSDWRNDYLNSLYFMNLAATFVKTDILSAVFDGLTGFANLVNAYNTIGVEYTSGNGDYAEWLERDEPKENISAGDIVAVIGGKITKDFKGKKAEQFMVVSNKPIMLGNTPTEEKEYLGNKIAFIGQVPVKVYGPVRSGDFIISNPDIPGYGKAVHPDEIDLDQVKYSVGRAWDTDPTPGIKLVTTLVGFHNGDYLNILKKSNEKLQLMESRLEKIEAILKLDTSKK